MELCRVGHNESFGEESLLLNEPISYSVVVSRDVELAVIHRTALHGVFLVSVVISELTRNTKTFLTSVKLSMT